MMFFLLPLSGNGTQRDYETTVPEKFFFADHNPLILMPLLPTPIHRKR
jgi:hypothetical protein